MVLHRASGETWCAAAYRYAELEGVSEQTVNLLFSVGIAEGFCERRAAYLALAHLGICDDVEGL